MANIKIIFASNNPGKIRELQSLLQTSQIEIMPQSEFSVPDIEETGITFVENALLKARHAAQLTGLPVIADDSGLEVFALKGKPGIYSARYAGIGATDQQNMDKLLQDLQNIPDEKRTARFYCTLVLLNNADDPTPLICQGSWYGTILKSPQGKNGFGYDPIFYVANEKCSSAELPATKKNQLSHRGQALRLLIDKLPEKIHHYD